MFDLLAKRFPDDFNKMIEAAWQKTRQGATDADVTVAARGELIAKLPGMVALATDDTILDYHALTQRQLEALRDRDVTACVEMAFPTGKPLNMVANMPPELRDRDMVLLTKALREADVARRITLNQEELLRVAQRAASGMTPGERAVFSDEAARQRSAPELACASASPSPPA